MSEEIRHRTAAQVVAALHTFLGDTSYTCTAELLQDSDFIQEEIENSSSAREAMVAYLESVTLPPRWIPTEERPASECDCVIRYSDSARPILATWQGKHWVDEYGETYDIDDVSHYIILPALPKQP